MMSNRSVAASTKQVYIAESASGFHKVGISKHPHQRIAQLDVPGVIDLRLIHTFPVMFAHRSEKLLHNALKDYHVSPEWFQLPGDVVCALCECHGEYDMLVFCGLIEL